MEPNNRAAATSSNGNDASSLQDVLSELGAWRHHVNLKEADDDEQLLRTFTDMKENMYTLQLGLRHFEAAAGGAPAWNWMMAGSLVVMLPVIIVFITFQRYFIEGVALTGMGGR